MRFQKRFQFQIQILDDLDADQIFIQPMILQPFVENAIWHGLMHKEGPGVLDICVQNNNGQILISIEDNGIGREKAASFANRRLVNKKSFGIDITKERLQHYYQDKYSLKWIDKIENGDSGGTKVELKIPVGNEDHILNPKSHL
jgi:sensor histidine kinase YesM